MLRTTIRSAAACLVLAAASIFATSASAQEKDWVFAATVEIDTTQMAFIVSGKIGGGTLEYAGKEYKFDIGGLGVGGVGVQTINAVGAVYNMDDVSKFPGTYVESRIGATMGKGKGLTRLSNENGVIMDLKTSMEGVALSVGVDGMIVKMK